MSQFTIHPEDVSLFMDLFKGREDVYACQWTDPARLGEMAPLSGAFLIREVLL